MKMQTIKRFDEEEGVPMLYFRREVRANNVVRDGTQLALARYFSNYYFLDFYLLKMT